ncbi:MAG: hypothetical protein AAGC68_05110 [Verrucomicrobiota bacterium]
MHISAQTVFLALLVLAIHIAVILGGASTRAKAASWFQSEELETNLTRVFTKGGDEVVAVEETLIAEASETNDPAPVAGQSEEMMFENPLGEIIEADDDPILAEVRSESREAESTEEPMTAVTDVRLLSGRIEPPKMDRYGTSETRVVSADSGDESLTDVKEEPVAIARPIEKSADTEIQTPTPAETLVVPAVSGRHKVREIRPVSVR